MTRFFMMVRHFSTSAHYPTRPYLLGCLLLVSIILLSLLIHPQQPLTWQNTGLLLSAVWCGFRWFQIASRLKARQAIANRLSRLPLDFVVLHDLLVHAPWGDTRIDHVIVSRFGLVIAADGPSPGWLMEQVEAVRSRLFTGGVITFSLPIRTLVLLPPGAPDAYLIESDAPVIRIEQVRLNHLAPSNEPVLSSTQIKAILRQLVEVQQVV